MSVSPSKQDHQGGKKFGMVKSQQDDELIAINQEYLEDDAYEGVEDLAQKLETYKRQFVEYDRDNSGDLGLMDLKYMMEKLDQAKTHLELKKMLKEVALINQETITYRDFLNMMLGKRNSVLRLILLFEERMKEKDNGRTGPPPKRSLDSLP